MNHSDMPLLDQTPSFNHQHDPHHPAAHQSTDSNGAIIDSTNSQINSLISSSSAMTSSTTSSCGKTMAHTCTRSSVDNDLEILDRELNALDAAMPLVDPEITQGAEQLEKAISRKRSHSEEDRLVREALSQFYLPSPRLLTGIDDCPLLLGSDAKRCKTSSSTNDLLDCELNLYDHNQNQKEFDVIMDALRLSSSSSSSNSTTVGNSANDSCGQAAMMSENGVFHNLVVASLET